MDENLYDRFVEDNELRQHTREELLEEIIYKMENLTKKAFFSDREVSDVREDDWQGHLVVKFDEVMKILGK